MIPSLFVDSAKAWIAVPKNIIICISKAIYLAGSATYSFSAVKVNTIGTNRLTVRITISKPKMNHPPKTNNLVGLPLFPINTTTAFVQNNTDRTIEENTRIVSIYAATTHLCSYSSPHIAFTKKYAIRAIKNWRYLLRSSLGNELFPLPSTSKLTRTRMIIDIIPILA